MKVIHKKGYSLIELLVVVSIIGLLAIASFTVLGESRKDSRDSRRMQDMRYLQTQLERYYNHNGRYPDSTNVASGISGHFPTSNHYANSGNSSWSALEVNAGFDLPRDPLNEPGSGYNYLYLSYTGAALGCPGRQYYLLMYKLEGGQNTPTLNPGVDYCSSDVIWHFYDTNYLTIGVGGDLN